MGVIQYWKLCISIDLPIMDFICDWLENSWLICKKKKKGKKYYIWYQQNVVDVYEANFKEPVPKKKKWNCEVTESSKGVV